jgi:two-component system nitrate/nitrite response regulator NarL
MPDKKLKLLIADDHRMFIEGLQLMLRHELQMDIVAFAINGKEAIEMCVKYDIDIVIMDIHMPLINGIEATKMIKQICPCIKVIITSSADNTTIVADALKAGADAYVLKDAGCDELAKAFKTIATDEIFISRSLAHFFMHTTGQHKTREECIQFKENFITPREQAIVKLISEGCTNQQIADTLSIAVSTADTHRKNILAKLRLPNTAALVRFAVENKLV